MIDQVEVTIVAGKGGDGLVSFRREKFVPKGGPNGGDGGRGGDVIIEATQDIGALIDLYRQKVIRAKNGQNGKPNNMTGADGQPMIIKVPVGSVIHELLPNNEKKLLIDVTKLDQQITIARGGRGGWGNWHFATATRQAPRYAQPGLPGQSKKLLIELKLLADVGLVGLPNAGKSTLLSRISNARPKIADYPFTTLSPNIGVVTHKRVTFVVADIPGLIEGAHLGKGLGDQFLRHIERTKVIVYLIDGAVTPWPRQYHLLTRELKAFNPQLVKKTTLIVLNKIDLVIESVLPKGWLTISSVTGAGLSQLLDQLITLVKIDKQPKL